MRCRMEGSYMKYRLIALAIVLSLGGLGSQAEAARKPHTHPGLLSFDVMFGVDGAYLEEAHAIRGIVGDEMPWEILDSATGSLDDTGHLSIHVRGLVFADNPRVPKDLRGKNDETEFRALVSCLDDNSNPVNVTTAGFPATHGGNAEIDAVVALPNPCVAPLVFVMAGSEDKWFSVTGMEIE